MPGSFRDAVYSAPFFMLHDHCIVLARVVQRYLEQRGCVSAIERRVVHHQQAGHCRRLVVIDVEQRVNLLHVWPFHVNNVCSEDGSVLAPERHPPRDHRLHLWSIVEPVASVARAVASAEVRGQRPLPALQVFRERLERCIASAMVVNQRGKLPSLRRGLGERFVVPVTSSKLRTSAYMR